MPTGAVKLLKVPGVSLANGTYPLFGASSPTAWKTVQARYVTDLRQVITIPYETGMEDVNMLHFNGAYWWVLSQDTATDTGRTVRMTVSYCAPSSILNTTVARISGAWDRLPYSQSPWLQRSAVSSAMKHTKTWVLPKLPKTDDYQIYWLQATVQETASDGSGTLTHRLGCFVACNKSGDTQLRLNYDGTKTYPTLTEILGSAGAVFGTTSDSILDISISVRCPWKYQASGDTISINRYGGTTTERMPVLDGSKGVLYQIDKDPVFLGASQQWEDSMTTALSDLEIASGQITLRTEDTASISSQPTHGLGSGAWRVYTVSDLTGVLTYVECRGYLSCIQEGHLPWSGTSWEQYRAYSLAYDRQAMEMSIDYSHQRQGLALAESAVNSISSVAMGAMGGNPMSIAVGAVSAVAGFGIQAWATGEEQRIADSEARDTQALAERRAQGGPSTPYNTGYGLIYCLTNARTPASVWLEMPEDLDTSTDTAYTDWFGFPSELVGDARVTEGFYRGEIWSVPIAPTGPRWDRLVEVFRSGFRFKEV